MKKRHVFLIIGLIIIADQALKIYIKTHYHPNETHPVLGNWFHFILLKMQEWPMVGNLVEGLVK